jgi:enoyl-CoA hydratase
MDSTGVQQLRLETLSVEQDGRVLTVRVVAPPYNFMTAQMLLIGLTTTVGGQRLAQLIGPARALEMLLEGRMYSRQEALEMGLIRRLVPPESLVGEAQELGARYAQRNRNNVAVQKRIFNEDYLLPPAESLRREGIANAAGILSGPAPHALRAWVDMQQKGTGDSVFLTDLEPWMQGNVVDLNEV